MSDDELALPANYPQLLEELKQTVRAARLRAHQTVNWLSSLSRTPAVLQSRPR